MGDRLAPCIDHVMFWLTNRCTVRYGRTLAQKLDPAVIQGCSRSLCDTERLNDPVRLRTATYAWCVGLIVLVATLAVTVVIAAVLHLKNGRFASKSDGERLGVSELGSPLGERATLVQFSSAFCAPCRATRVLLTDIAAKTPGVVTIEIDAEEQLELTRKLNILRTPTVLVLDAKGRVTRRASGLPRRDQVLAALNHAVV